MRRGGQDKAEVVPRAIDVRGRDRAGFARQVTDAALKLYIDGMWADVPLVGAVFTWFQPQQDIKWQERHWQIARLLYESAVRLGGVPVKAMQFISLRDDLEPAYTKTFAKAQQDVAIRSPPRYVQDVVAQLGLTALLQYVAEPNWSASIAQVHLGTLQGQPVVVKVKHEGATDQYEEDLKLMAELGRYVNKYEEARGAGVMLEAIAEKLRSQLAAELNFTLEAENQRRVRDNFEVDPLVVVPEILAASDRALVMRRLPGRSVADIMQGWKGGVPASERHLLSRPWRDRVYAAFAAMVLRHRFVQMDAHPGNIFVVQADAAVEPGAVEPVGLLDFGQCATVPEDVIGTLADFLRAAPVANEAGDIDPEYTPVRVRGWLKLLGVEVELAKAIPTAQLLLLGAPGPTFPDTRGMRSDMVPYVLIFLYLSRLERSIAHLRRALGDTADAFAVLRAFRQQL